MSPPDASAEVLEKRLARERASRLEAETIAERTTRDLYDTKRRFELVLRGAGDGIVGVDEKGHITFINPAGAALVGWAPAELVGRPLHETVHPPAARAELCSASCSLLEAVATGTRSEAAIECLYQRRDGGRFPTECLVNPMEEPGGKRVGAVLVFRDVSDRKRAEEARRTAVERLMEIERLREMDQFKTRFINVAAHELNTPLTPLKLQLHLLRDGQAGPLTEKQAKALEILERNLNRLAALVQDLLDVARIEEKRLTLRRERAYLDALLHETVDAFSEQAKEQRITLTVDAAPDAWVDVDAKRITQVLYNLVGNAFKFTPAGGAITVGAELRQREAVVRVRDTGVGLTKAQLGKLFLPFTQHHDPLQRTDAGAGLGLYISKGIVEQHGGTVGAESDGPDKGSTFWFTVPLAAATK